MTVPHMSDSYFLQAVATDKEDERLADSVSRSVSQTKLR